MKRGSDVDVPLGMNQDLFSDLWLFISRHYQVEIVICPITWLDEMETNDPPPPPQVHFVLKVKYFLHSHMSHMR